MKLGVKQKRKKNEKKMTMRQKGKKMEKKSKYIYIETERHIEEKKTAIDNRTLKNFASFYRRRDD